MNVLAVSGLTKRFESTLALDEVDLEVRKGEYFCLAGPTNAGKSTLLKTIAGLHRQDAGSIAVRGRDLDGVAPRSRRLGMVFQADALFPDRTGFENIAFALRASGKADATVERRVAAVADLLGIRHLLSRLPHTFSGGERKRVAIGRAIAAPSDLLLLDEPLSGIDARLRVMLRVEFKDWRHSLADGVIHVTHDHAEAMSLADRIAILNEGRIEQVGTPDEIYHSPANRFVAGFFGSPPMNLVPVEVAQYADSLQLVGDGFRVLAPDLAGLRSPLPRALEIGVRAEDIAVAPVRSAITPHPGKILWTEKLGTRQVLEIKTGAHALRAFADNDAGLQETDIAWFGFNVRPGHLLDSQSGRFIRWKPPH